MMIKWVVLIESLVTAALIGRTAYLIFAPGARGGPLFAVYLIGSGMMLGITMLTLLGWWLFRG